VNLIIEQGNTSTKVAVFEENQLMNTLIYPDFNCEILAALFRKYELDKGILSTVVSLDPELIDSLEKELSHFILLNETVDLPLTIGYDTPETLGRDRVAAAVGANYLKPAQDLLVVDAGTAITYEVIEASGLYVGGNISPGMTTRFRALNYYTSKLPLVSEKEEIPLIATNTIEAIQAGIVNGIIYEIDGYIDALNRKYPNLFVFLTGGHSFYFERRLKNRIFADINLVLTGLNRILEYNVEN